MGRSNTTWLSDNIQPKVESLFSVEQDLKFITPGLKFKGLFFLTAIRSRG